MISEGTNIPRLQVCCHLSRIKTELHFRQILGRILRVTGELNQEACLFMPAEKTLIEYAYRVAEDIPQENATVRFETANTGIHINEFDETFSDTPDNQRLLSYQTNIDESYDFQIKESSPPLNQLSLLTQSYEATLNVFGQFHQDILALNVSPFD
jgi:superfamily II DNA or RNA helicase